MESEVKMNKDSFSKLELEQLTFVKKLGFGQFGNVYLVASPSGHLFALKGISKHKITTNKLEKYILV